MPPASSEYEHQWQLRWSLQGFKHLSDTAPSSYSSYFMLLHNNPWRIKKIHRNLLVLDGINLKIHHLRPP